MIDKPKLTVSEQIEHLKAKGVRFTIVSEDDALEYLSEKNNYFKLTAYRKNYDKNSEDKYVNLEFAYLKDLAIIDMRLRYCLLTMCLDIEHNVRVKLIKAIEESDEDGYSVVADFQDRNQKRFIETKERAQKSPYCKDIVSKYNEQMPVWAFVEIAQLGQLIDFYRFVGERLENERMTNEYYLLQEIRNLRNACAHSNCVLNDLKSQKNPRFKPSLDLCNALGRIGISRGVRDRKLSNDRIRQIATLLYLYKDFVQSKDLKNSRAEQIREVFIGRMYRNIEYYQTSERVLTTFEFFRRLIDNWYPMTYNSSTEQKSKGFYGTTSSTPSRFSLQAMRRLISSFYLGRRDR